MPTSFWYISERVQNVMRSYYTDQWVRERFGGEVRLITIHFIRADIERDTTGSGYVHPCIRLYYTHTPTKNSSHYVNIVRRHVETYFLLKYVAVFLEKI
jgi:hypothetical protein